MHTHILIYIYIIYIYIYIYIKKNPQENRDSMNDEIYSR